MYLIIITLLIKYIQVINKIIVSLCDRMAIQMTKISEADTVRKSIELHSSLCILL